jgi:hypothetical protein
LEELNRIISKYVREEIAISAYYIEKVNEGKRDIDPNLIKDKIITKEYYLVEKQLKNGEIRYKFVYRLSNKYDIVIVVTEKPPKTLKVITAYRTSRG